MGLHARQKDSSSECRAEELDEELLLLLLPSFRMATIPMFLFTACFKGNPMLFVKENIFLCMPISF